MFGLPRTLFRELFVPAAFERLPEPRLVMDDEPAVEAFDAAGRPGGALSGAYLYHLSQMAQRILPGDHVLDLGCGSAVLLARLAVLCPEAQFTGVDLSEPMLERARTRVAAMGLTNLRVVQADMTKLEAISDASIDVLVSSMALHHLPDVAALDATLAASARVLKPTGALYINDFGRLKHTASIDYFVSRAGDGESPLLLEDYHHSLRAAFSLDEVRGALSSHFPGLAFHSTFPIPFSFVACTPAKHIGTPRSVLDAECSALPRVRREDLALLKTCFSLGRLKSAI